RSSRRADRTTTRPSTRPTAPGGCGTRRGTGPTTPSRSRARSRPRCFGRGGRWSAGGGGGRAWSYSRGRGQASRPGATTSPPGWSYRDVLPYFKKSEDYEGGADEYHGAGGPLPVTHIKEPNPATLAMIEAAAEIGVPRNDDPNADDILGVGLVHMTVRNGLRMSTWTAFIEPIVGNPLLTVTTRALRTRLDFG